MSASHDASSEPHEIHPHPPMPAVHDEAADSPAWLPVMGLSILVVMILFVMLRSAMHPAEAEVTVEAAAPAAEIANAPPAE